MKQASDNVSTAFFTNTAVGTKPQKKVTSSFVTSYRITEWLRLKGTSGGHLVQHPVQATLHLVAPD